MQVTERDIVFEAGGMALELRFKDKALDALGAENEALRQRVAELEVENSDLRLRVAELDEQSSEPAGQGALHMHACSEMHPQQDIYHPEGHPHRHDHASPV